MYENIKPDVKMNSSVCNYWCTFDKIEQMHICGLHFYNCMMNLKCSDCKNIDINKQKATNDSYRVRLSDKR